MQPNLLIAFALAALLTLASLWGGCGPEPKPTPPATPGAPVEMDEGVASLLGHWQLDADTRAWVPRACVILNVDDLENAAIQVVEEGEQVVVRLLGTPATPFVGMYRDQAFDGRQILATTANGRFCGNETAVRLRLRLERGNPDALHGTWQTPDCDVCPDRSFGAIRTGR